MGDILVAIALLCQVHGNKNINGFGYDDTKNLQIKCQQTLVKCVYDSEEVAYPKKLADCIKKGGY